MTVKQMKTKQLCDNLHDDAGDHGARLQGAAIYPNQLVWVEVDTHDSPHDGWVHIVGPTSGLYKLINIDGTYKSYGKPAWVELAHLEELKQNKTIFNIEVDWDSHTITLI